MVFFLVKKIIISQEESFMALGYSSVLALVPKVIPFGVHYISMFVKAPD